MAQPTAIPGNMKWSPEAAEQALAERKFIRVGGPKNKTTERKLSGAMGSWNQVDEPKEANIEFDLANRLAGTRDDIFATLVLAGVSEADAARAVNSTITRDNYQDADLAVAIDAELRAADALADRAKAEKAAAVMPVNWKNVVWFGQRVRQAEMKPVSNADNKTLATGGAKGKRASLAEAVAELMQSNPGNKVINVNAIDTKTGGGYRVIDVAKIPKAASIARPVPIVASTLDKYQAALALAFPGADVSAYIETFKEGLKAKGMTMRGKKASPRAKKAASPKGAPIGAQVVPAPRLTPPRSDENPAVSTPRAFINPPPK